jgi:hypothetical protein
MTSSVLTLLAFPAIIVLCWSHSLTPYGDSTDVAENGDRPPNHPREMNLANMEEQEPYLDDETDDPTQPLGRNGVISDKKHWPKGVVPYIITGTFSKSTSSSNH